MGNEVGGFVQKPETRNQKPEASCPEPALMSNHRSKVSGKKPFLASAL